MPNYRRRYIEGGLYFFTVRLSPLSQISLIQQIDILRHTMRKERAMHPFEIVEAVILPDHLHAIWRLPLGDADFSSRWGRIKAGFSKALPDQPSRSLSKQIKRERGIWQRRFWEHSIGSEEELAHYRACCWYNPVKHGYVSQVFDWPFSSFHRAVKSGAVAADWAFAT